MDFFTNSFANVGWPFQTWFVLAHMAGVVVLIRGLLAGRISQREWAIVTGISVGGFFTAMVLAMLGIG